MARTREQYRALREDLVLALEHVDSQRADLEAMMSRATREFSEGDQMAWAAVGFTIHNLYNAIENYFLRVAKFFENEIEGATWHRDLVNRMAHEIPALRPALLGKEQLEAFHELRAFRHTFRSLYDRRLDPRRVRLAAEHATPALAALRAGHERFIARIDEIADAL